MNVGPKIMGNLRCLSLALAVAATVITISEQAAADETTDVTSAVQVTAAMAEPALAGSCTEVRFELVNDGREDLQVLGLDAGITSRSRLVAKIGTGDTVTLESVSIPAGETIDFSRSRWFEFCGLTTTLQSGDSFVADLRIVGGTTPFSVHVH
ncbi:hypothetical protein BAL199_27506 [alpha proteobacterium BAL199]|jgi:copper(I)-binding protein|nr:hypothetical protein BAL199_27506 [alpha proteobacterium BAL199]